MQRTNAIPHLGDHHLFMLNRANFAPNPKKPFMSIISSSRLRMRAYFLHSFAYTFAPLFAIGL